MNRWIPLLLLVLPVAYADEQDTVRRAVEEGRLRPLAEILATVQVRHPGRIVEVELERDAGRYVYELELVGPDRRKFEIKVDGASGEILGADAATHAPLHPVPTLLREVLRAYPGQVIDAEYEHGLYRIVVALADGAQVRVSVDPSDGRVFRDDARASQLARMQPMPEVLDRILSRHPGIVLEAELERRPDGGYHYDFEIRGVDGDTINLQVDAFNGDILTENETDAHTDR